MRYCIALLLMVLVIGCGGPEPRRPVEVKSGSFFKESIERTKKLLAEEEKAIRNIMEQDTVHEYLSSSNGFWYFYETKNDTATYQLKTGDQILFSYNLMTLGNDTIYTAEEIGPKSHVIDKQQLFPGLQNAVKLLKINEKPHFSSPLPSPTAIKGTTRPSAPKHH